MHLECLIPDFGGLQILYLQAICKGYLQAHNSLCFNGISAESLQMADKMRKKLCVAVRERRQFSVFTICTPRCRS